MRLTIGDRLGPHEILAPLGAGGMGQVWKARDARSGDESSHVLSGLGHTRVALTLLCLNVTSCRICHMDGVKTSVGEGGRVVLPSAYRRALGVRVGDEVVVTLEDDGLRIMTLAKAVERAQALVKRFVKSRRSLSRELLRERRREASRG